MSLAYYRQIAEEHWNEFLPKRWKRLQKAGTLDAELTKAVEQTDREMQAALEAGIPRDQAWEEIRHRYLMPEHETRHEPSPNRPGLRLLRDAIEATQKAYDDL